MIAPLLPAHADRDYRVDDRFTVRRHLTGYPYGRGTQVGVPTPTYEWLLLLDGRVVGQDVTKRALVQAARKYGVEGYSS